MKTAAQHAKELNDKTRAYMDADGGWAFLLSEDPMYWKQQGILTAMDLDRTLAVSSHSDLYKQVYGFRPQPNWTGIPTADIWEAIRDLEEALDAEADWSCAG